MFKLYIEGFGDIKVQNVLNAPYYENFIGKEFNGVKIYFYPETSLETILEILQDKTIFSSFTVQGHLEIPKESNNVSNYINNDGTIIYTPPLRTLNNYNIMLGIEQNLMFEENPVWKYSLQLGVELPENICKNRLEELKENNNITQEVYDYLNSSFDSQILNFEEGAINYTSEFDGDRQFRGEEGLY